MCLAVYIASDVPLPTVGWDEDQPGFHVQDATKDYFCPRNPLRVHTSRPFFYAVGSHDGCGCGFMSYGEDWDDEAGEYVESTTTAQLAAWQAMADYLTDALRQQPSVEVFTFCSGDESCPPTRHRRARPGDFLTDRTLFAMGQSVVVSEQATDPDAAPDPAR